MVFTSVARYSVDNEALKVNTDPDLCKEQAPGLCFHNAIHVASYREGEESTEKEGVGLGESGGGCLEQRSWYSLGTTGWVGR